LEQQVNNARSNSGRVFFNDGDFKLPDAAAHLVFWPLFVVGFTLDLWSKWVVFKWLETKSGYSVSVVDGFFQLVMAQNAGAAFGIAAGKRGLLVIVSVIALIAIIGVFLFGQVCKRMVHVALALFAAGICGNLYDRIFNQGFVRDFLDVYYGHYHWPAFNVADSMLCIAVGLLVISSFATEKPCQRHVQPHK
jgi:signal peptidase II